MPKIRYVRYFWKKHPLRIKRPFWDNIYNRCIWFGQLCASFGQSGPNWKYHLFCTILPQLWTIKYFYFDLPQISWGWVARDRTREARTPAGGPLAILRAEKHLLGEDLAACPGSSSSLPQLPWLTPCTRVRVNTMIAMMMIKRKKKRVMISTH